MRVFVRWALLASCLLVSFARAGELDDRAAIRDAVTTAFKAGDYDTLDRLHTLYSDFAHQRTASGASKMGLFIDGLGEGRDATDAVLQRDIARAERWTAAHADSPFGYLLQAKALAACAHHVRGGGYANTVAPEAWPVFHSYNQRAIKVLADHRELASSTTTWHALMITLGRDEGFTPAQMRRLFDDGVARDPMDFRLYFYMVDALLPKWNGSTQRLDGFIRNASAHAPPAYGMELYARLYSGVEEEQFPGTLYADSFADWTLMKIGLKTWVQNFPTAWNKNIFAYHACLSGDRSAAEPLFLEIAGHPDPEIWNDSVSPTFETCAAWVSDPQALPPSPPPRRSSGEQSAREGTSPSVFERRATPLEPDARA